MMAPADFAGWQCLAEAIIRQACADYDAALRKRRLHPGQPRWHTLCEAHAAFFRSEWFASLSSLDGEALEQAIRRYAEMPGSRPLNLCGDPLPV